MHFAGNPGSLGENLAKQERIPCPRNRTTATPLNCFRLISIPGAPGLHPAHELVQLAQKIDWDRFEAAFAASYSPDLGAPAKATRLMVGLQYLKYTFNESDESVVERWVENPYGQYFCGYTHLQHECPIHPTSMSRWRKRVGADRLLELLQETIALAKREGYVSQRDLERVNVDTTMQEKNITYPTDSKLLYRALQKLVVAARSRSIELRQSYLRVGKIAAVKASRYAHARQDPRMRRCLRKLRTYVGRLIRDIRRKASHPDEALATLLARADRVRQQQPHDTDKLYPGAPGHEPDVQCISKGKAHKRYESCPEPRRIGQKVAVARHQPRELDGGRPAAARQSLRRTYADRHLDRRAGRDRCGRDRCVRGQGLSRAWLYGGGERPSARTTKRRLTGGAEAPATT